MLYLLLYTFIFICTPPYSTGYAEVQSIDAEGIYIVGDGIEESAKTAKERAKKEAMRIALNKAGVYVESYSKIDNMQLTRDEMRTITGKIIKTTHEAYRTELVENHILKYTATITVIVDTDAIKLQLLKDREQILQLRERNSILKNDYEKLRKENLKLNIPPDYEMYALYQKSMNENIEKDERLEILNQMIEKEPNYQQGIAYALKASIYTQDEDYTQALEYDLKYLELNPDKASAYYYCASDYQNLRDWKNAVPNIYLAISYDPNNPVYQNAKNYIFYEMKKYGF